MTIPWGTSRHWDFFFFLIWELSTLSCSVPSALLSGEPGPGTSSLPGTSGVRHEQPPPPAPEQELRCGERPSSAPAQQSHSKERQATFTKSRQRMI